jgi:hypothetical protein
MDKLVMIVNYKKDKKNKEEEVNYILNSKFILKVERLRIYKNDYYTNIFIFLLQIKL